MFFAWTMPGDDGHLVSWNNVTTHCLPCLVVCCVALCVDSGGRLLTTRCRGDHCTAVSSFAFDAVFVVAVVMPGGFARFLLAEDAYRTID